MTLWHHLHTPIGRTLGYAVLLACLLITGSELPPSPLYAEGATVCDIIEDIPVTECNALADFYNATGGSAWANQSGWLSTTTACTWYGITCVSNRVNSLVLDSNNLVGSIPASLSNLANLVTLDLRFNKLSGSIPSSLGSLPVLETLNLRDNQLTGSIPAELGNLSKLKTLTLSYNQLSGSVPSSLGNLTNVERILLSWNLLTGPIPPELGSLPNLESLFIENNQLTGSIPPQLGNAPSLLKLALEGNSLSGSIPPELGNIAPLQQLALLGNQLSGVIPPQLANLSNLTFLRLDYNRLTATDSALITLLDTRNPNWRTTQTVPPTGVGATPLSGSSVQVTWTPIAYTGNGGNYQISYATTAGGPYTLHGATADKTASSYTVGGLASNTAYYFVVQSFTPAHAADNQRSDLLSDYSQEATTTTSSFSCSGVAEIPQSECEALVTFYNSTGGPNWVNKTGWLSTNTPCSTPWRGVTCVGGRVSVLNLTNNQLNGTLPAALGQLGGLTGLNLKGNQLRNAIPLELANLSGLTFLHLGENQLTGSIPPGLGGLINLRELRLNDNQLSGAIPTQLGSLANLEVLWLVRNSLSGPAPVELGNLSKLTQLGISQNKLTGSIPASLGNLTKLTNFYLNDNQFQGAIPSTLGQLTELVNFYILNNQLSGNVPPTLVNLTKTTGFNIRFNKLTASDPALISFLNAKDDVWLSAQTLAPTNLQAVAQSSSAIQLTWTPILYVGDGGYYEISFATAAGGPYTVRGVTTNKTANSYTISGLSPNTRYYFVVRTYTPPHEVPPAGYQQNALWSDYSQEANAQTQAETTASAPTIVSAPVQSAVVGRNYVYAVVASGSSPITYRLLSAPTGMGIDQATGIISWTPAQSGAFNVRVEASNALGNNAQEFTVTVSAAPDITTGPVTTAVVGQPYAYDVDAAGNPPPTFALPVAPAGMTINASSGLIGWTPSATGQFSITVSATNSVDTDTQSFLLNVVDPNAATAPALTSQPVTAATVGVTYVYDVEATGVPAPTFSLLAAPAGMQINATAGAITWTPDRPGVVDVTVQASNSAGVVTQAFTINVAAPADGDAYEDDDACARAREIPVTGAKQGHTFHDINDTDWIKFPAQAFKTFIIEVQNLGPKADAVIALHNACEAPPSDLGDNAFGSTLRLEWDSLKGSDFYYIKIQQFDGATSGDETNYTVSVTLDNLPPTAPQRLRCVSVNQSTLGVQWKESPERDVKGYRIAFQGNVSGNEFVSGSGTSYYELEGLTLGQTYNLRVRSLDFSDNESPPSGEVQCTVRQDSDLTQPSFVLNQPTAGAVYSTTAEALTFTGAAQDPQANLSRANVKNMTNNQEGWDFSLVGANATFRVQDLALTPGNNTVRITVYDDAGNFKQSDLTVRRLNNVAGAVIIVAGHNETFGLQPNIYNAANRAYRIFRSAGFSDDNIYYIAPVGQDPDGDGAPNTDESSSPAAVQNAITVWAKDRVGPDKPLFLYLMDHGFAEKFCVSGCGAAGQMTPADLDDWLRTLENDTGVNMVNIVIEACQSGSFIDRFNGDVANSLAKAGRVVIASTGRDNNAYASAQGAYFSDTFFSCVADSNSLKACFDQAKSAVAATGVNQTPWLDDNGDGLYNDSDGTVAAARYVTNFFSSIRPEITAVSVTKQGANGVLSANVQEGAEEVDLVWAAIYPPSFVEPSDVTLNLNVPIVRLEPDPTTAGRYLFNYTNGFAEPGDYRIVFYAQDRGGINAVPRRDGEKFIQFLPMVSKN